MSLKESLKICISQKNGEIFSYEEFEILCKRNGQRTETGTRRLRELMGEGDIDIITSKKGAITGWFWKHKSYPYQSKLF